MLRTPLFHLLTPCCSRHSHAHAMASMLFMCLKNGLKLPRPLLDTPSSREDAVCCCCCCSRSCTLNQELGGIARQHCHFQSLIWWVPERLFVFFLDFGDLV